MRQKWWMNASLRNHKNVNIAAINFFPRKRPDQMVKFYLIWLYPLWFPTISHLVINRPQGWNLAQCLALWGKHPNRSPPKLLQWLSGERRKEKGAAKLPKMHFGKGSNPAISEMPFAAEDVSTGTEVLLSSLAQWAALWAGKWGMHWGLYYIVSEQSIFNFRSTRTSSKA